MNAYFVAGAVVLLIGALITAASRPREAALEAHGLSGGKYTVRHGIGLGLGALGAVLVNVGVFTAATSVVIKIVAAFCVIFLVGLLLWSTAGQRQHREAGEE